MPHFVVTGAEIQDPTEGATPPNRLEIIDLIENERMFSLYIQALDAMSKTPQEKVNSFFAIGGIHGMPYEAWDGAGEDSPAEENGYCSHGSVLFPTWHRPYVALYEQVMQKHAIEIARTYTIDKPDWEKAAADLRQPFWDWARHSVPPPEVIALEKVTITTPDGKRTQVDNPLLRYRFNPIPDSFYDPYDTWPTTLRHPTSRGPDGKDDVAALKKSLQANQRALKSKTYNLLTRVRTWPAFSNHSVEDGGSGSNSLEAIHDSIHVLVGMDGHMGDPAVAAFDPIFFLHHCQVDRLLALWSALNHGVWVNESTDLGGTFTIPPGSIVDEATSLAPFWNSQTSFWTSSDAAGTVPQQLGYSYPEFNGLDMDDEIAVRDGIASIVNMLYGGVSFMPFPVRTLSAVTNLPQERASATPTKVAEPTTLALHAPARLTCPASAGDGEEPKVDVTVNDHPPETASAGFWEWTARIHVKKYEVGGSFSVLLFLGEVPENPEDWLTSPYYVGAHHGFVNSIPERCTNCRRQADLVIEGFVHLNEAIAQHSGLGGFEPNQVKSYLQEKFHWRVRKVDGTVIPLENVPSLEVMVIAKRLTLPPGAMFPVPGGTVYHPDVTHGRVGGARVA